MERDRGTPADAILGLTEAFKKDTNPNKVNLGVGVYKDDQGATPILNCIKRQSIGWLRSSRPKGIYQFRVMRHMAQAFRHFFLGNRVRLFSLNVRRQFIRREEPAVCELVQT